MYNVSDAYKTAIAAPSRQFRLSGTIRLQSGTSIDITDSNVIGELSITTQMMSGSSSDTVIDIGAVCAAVLSMTVQDDNSADSFADARVRLLTGLKLADGTFEDVKMGIFYIDASTIRRVKNHISFTAYDKMTLLHFIITDTMRVNMSGMNAYGAAAYLCSLVGIQMEQTNDMVSAFPNGTMKPDFSSESLETARDVIMWCGQLMGCFTRITRGGKLEFVQIKAENDDKGMIIPVREIAARQRFKTEFADSVLRISTLTMKKPDGKTARAYLTGTSSSKRSLELALEPNPLVIGQSEKSVPEVLKDMLIVLKTAYFRPFNTDIANDPALDAGDYVRLRGGSIDTERGYATGVITHSTWVYQGKQSLVNVGAAPVLSQLSEDDSTASAETAEAALLTLASDSDSDSEESGDISGEDIIYKQPEKQSVKTAGSAGSSVQKLRTGTAACSAVTNDSGLVIQGAEAQAVISPKISKGKQTVVINPGQGYPTLSLTGDMSDGGEMHVSAPYLMFDVTPQKLYYYGVSSTTSAPHSFEISGSAYAFITLRTDYDGLNIRWGSNDAYQIWLRGDYLDIRCNGKNLLSMNTSGNFLLGSMRYTNGVLDCGGNIRVTNSAIQLGDDRLYVSGGELFFNGKRVVLEDLN